MKNIKIKINKAEVSFDIPTEYKELNQEQFTAIVRYCYEKQTPIEERLTDAIKLLWIFCNKKNKAVKKIFSELTKSGDLLQIIEENNLPFEKPVACRKWFLKKVHTPFSDYYGPEDGFSDMKFGEFVYADTLFLSYINNQSFDSLLTLAAVLFRKKRKNERIPFKDLKVEKAKKQIRKFNWYEIYSVFYNYMLVRMYIAEKYIYIFPQKKNENDNPETENDFNPNGWFEARAMFVENLADLEKLDNLNVHDVLFYVNNKIKKNAQS